MKVIYYLVKGINKILYYDVEKIEMQEIIDSIIDSRFYIEYIDRKDKVRYENPRYAKYLNYKYLAYLKYVIPEEKRKIFEDTLKNEPKLYANVDEIYNKFLNEKKEIDDYRLIEESEDIDIFIYIDEENNTLTIDHSETYKNIRQIIISTKDEDFFKLGKEYMERLVEKDIDHLANEFLNKNHTTILLPTFLTKVDNEYLENIICVNVYECGIINIKLLLADKRKQNLLLDNSIGLGGEIYSKVEIPKHTLNYKSIDFFNKDIIDNMNIWDIINEYVERLKNILTWVNLREDNSTTQLEFQIIKGKNKLTSKEIAALLLNCNGDYIDGFREEYLNNIKQKHIVLDRKKLYAYVNNIALVQYIEKELFVAINKGCHIDEHQYPAIAILNSIENSRIYEFAIMQKFYYYNLYNKLKSVKRNDLNIDQFKKEISKKEEFETNYSEDAIFQEKTSYRELYRKICKSLLVEYDYKYKVEKEEKRINDIIYKQELIYEKNKDSGKNLFSIISSFLTILLSMNTIPNIIKIIGKGLKEQINIDRVNDIGVLLINKNIIISIFITFALVVAIGCIVNKYYKSSKKMFKGN